MRFIPGIYAAAAGVLIGSSAAVTVGSGPAHAALDCGFDFSPSRPDVRSPQILADALAGCDTPPDEHVVTFALEYEQGGQRVVASVTTDSTIPPPYRLGGHHYAVSAACYAGTWRASVGIRGKIQGHQFTFNDSSRTVAVPSSQCHPRF
jgi:hypothetical protein